MATDSNTSRLSYIPEVTYGVTPAGNLTEIRHTGETLGAKKDTVQSAEIRSDRQISDLPKVGAHAEGGIQIELSAVAHRPFILAALGQTAWTDLALTVTVNAVASTQTLTGTAGDFDDIPVGGFIKIAGFTNPLSNGIKRIVSKAGNGSAITLAVGSIAADQSAVALTFSGKDARNGRTKTSFSIERELINDDGDSYFQAYVGMNVDQFDLKITSKAIITGGFTFRGKNGDAPAATIGTGYVAADASDVLNGTNNVGSLWNGVVAMTDKLKEMSFTVNNNLRGRDAIGEEGDFSVGMGQFQVTGQVNFYADDNTFYQKLLDHTDGGLGVVLTDVDGKSIGFTFPRVKFADADPNASAINTDAMLAPNFTSIMHKTHRTTMIVNTFD